MAIHRIIVDLGPAGKAREALLLNALHDIGAAPAYIIGPGSFSQLASSKGAIFHEVRLAVRGGVIADLWHGVRSPVAWESTASPHLRASVEAVIHRYHGTAPQELGAGVEAFGFWIAYWERVIESLGVTAAYSYASPHCPYSLALFFAAARHGIPFVMLRHTSLEDVSFMSSSLPSGLIQALELPADKRLVTVGHFERSADQLTGPYARARPIPMRSQAASMASPEVSLVSRGLRFVLRNTRRLRPPSVPKHGTTRTATQDPSSVHAPPLEWPEVLTRELRSVRNAAVGRASDLMRRTRDQRVLQTAYRLHVVMSRSRRRRSRYLYFPLHYQPERTTAPDAGVWVDMRRVVKRCLASMPDDMTLLIREHPTQFHPHHQGHLLRRPSFYPELLAEDPRVALAGMHEDPFDLLDGSSGVVTATGTVGWEALVRGKPVLCSPGAWYTRLPGAHCLDDDDEVEEFVGVANRTEQAPAWDEIRASLAVLATRALPLPVDRACDDHAAEEARLLASVVVHCVSP